MTNSFFRRILDLLSPRQCPGCGRRLSVSEPAVCHRCLLSAPVTGFPNAPYDNPMARMFWGLVGMERVVALFYYEAGGELALIVHAMKYYDRADVAETMGMMLAERLSPSGFFEGIDAIVPVPLSEDRLRQRGYNQSECLARGIAQLTGLPVCTNVLGRVSFKGSQTQLNARQRKGNVEHIFHLLDGAADVEGKHVLLVDDVMTTGATLLSCADALKGVNGIKISIATLGFTRS